MVGDTLISQLLSSSSKKQAKLIQLDIHGHYLSMVVEKARKL